MCGDFGDPFGLDVTSGKLVLRIVPLNGTHVHPQAPLKIALSGTPGLKLSKDVLGHKDAVDPGAEGPRFEIPFTAAQAGAQHGDARRPETLVSAGLPHAATLIVSGADPPAS